MPGADKLPTIKFNADYTFKGQIKGQEVTLYDNGVADRKDVFPETQDQDCWEQVTLIDGYANTDNFSTEAFDGGRGDGTTSTFYEPARVDTDGNAKTYVETDNTYTEELQVLAYLEQPGYIVTGEDQNGNAVYSKVNGITVDQTYLQDQNPLGVVQVETLYNYDKNFGNGDGKMTDKEIADFKEAVLTGEISLDGTGFARVDNDDNKAIAKPNSSVVSPNNQLEVNSVEEAIEYMTTNHAKNNIATKQITVDLGDTFPQYAGTFVQIYVDPTSV